jgi:hypothetical protein
MLYLTFLIVNFLIAGENNLVRLQRIKENNPTQINHVAWFIFYTALCLPVWYFIGWTMAVAVFLQHGFAFPIFYNWVAKLPLFNLSTTTTSKYDQALVKIIDWLNKKLKVHIAYSMLVVDTVLFVLSLFFLWL